MVLTLTVSLSGQTIFTVCSFVALHSFSQAQTMIMYTLNQVDSAWNSWRIRFLCLMERKIVSSLYPKSIMLAVEQEMKSLNLTCRQPHMNRSAVVLPAATHEPISGRPAGSHP